MRNTTRLPIVLAAVAALAACDRAPPIVGTDAVADDGGRMTIDADDVSVRRGRDAPFVVRVHRENFVGAVYVKFANVPSGVVIPDEDLGILAEAGKYTLKAGESAPLVDRQRVTATAIGPDESHATTTFEISVTE